MRVIIPVAGRGARHEKGDLKCLATYGRKPTLETKPILTHILDYVSEMDYSEIRIVVSPDNHEVISDYVGAAHPLLNCRFFEQPEPLGEGDAIWYGMKDGIKYSREPLLIILGDVVPMGAGAELFQSWMRHPDDQKPAYSILGMTQVDNPEQCTIVKQDSRRFVEKFIEVRGERLEGTHEKLSGVHYIRRCDYLFDKLDILKKSKVVWEGEFRLTQAFKEMRAFGEGFFAVTVHVDNPIS